MKKEIIEKLLILNNADLNVTHKITANNLMVAGAVRQKVKLAAKLFSHTVAQAVSRAASLGLLDGENWQECNKLFKLVRQSFTSAKIFCNFYMPDE